MKTTQIKNDSDNEGKSSLLKVLKYAGIIIGSIIVISLLLFVLFPDPVINTLFKDRITKTIKETFPAYSIQFADLHYSVWKNRLVIDSLKIDARDSSISAGAASVSIGGIGWLKTAWTGNLDSSNIKNLEFNVEGIAVDFHKDQKVLRLGALHISAPDSEMVSDSIKYYPSIDDEQFFAKSHFKQTRFNIDIPKITITGFNFPALIQGKAYKAGSITIHDILTDILVSMDKPNDINSPNPQMPNEALSSVKEIIKVDSLNIINGRLKYSERFSLGAKPGSISFSKVNVSVKGIANHTEFPDTAFINAKGVFMNSGTMNLLMVIPLTPKNLSFQYSGSLSKMDATLLNSFVEAGEQKRIKSGILQSAAFNINVNSGRASGTVAIVYNDLSIVEINSNTGSEDGIFDRIASIFGKLFIIRSSNMPDTDGLIKTGEIKFVRRPANPFLQFAWFALRSGVGDIVGFPPEVISAN